MKIFVEKQYLKILHISFETNFLFKKKLLQIFLKNMYFSILFALRYSYLISLCFALFIFRKFNPFYLYVLLKFGLRCVFGFSVQKPIETKKYNIKKTRYSFCWGYRLFSKVLYAKAIILCFQLIFLK